MAFAFLHVVKRGAETGDMEDSMRQGHYQNKTNGIRAGVMVLRLNQVHHYRFRRATSSVVDGVQGGLIYSLMCLIAHIGGTPTFLMLCLSAASPKQLRAAQLSHEGHHRLPIQNFMNSQC